MNIVSIMIHFPTGCHFVQIYTLLEICTMFTKGQPILPRPNSHCVRLSAALLKQGA